MKKRKTRSEATNFKFEDIIQKNIPENNFNLLRLNDIKKLKRICDSNKSFIKR